MIFVAVSWKWLFRSSHCEYSHEIDQVHVLDLPGDEALLPGDIHGWAREWSGKNKE